MAKSVSLNEYTYSVVAVTSGKLTQMSGRPISMGMTISFAAIVLDTLLGNPAIHEALKKALTGQEIMSPEDFERYMEDFYKTITQGAE